MFRAGAILLTVLGVLSTGCMTLRDRIAIRYGLPTSREKSHQPSFARARVKMPAPYEAEFENLYALTNARPPLRVAKAPASPAPAFPALAVPHQAKVKAAPRPSEPEAIVAPTHPDPLLAEMANERSQFHARLERYELEREAARYRWEASLLRIQADQLREQVASLDATWRDLSEKVARMESDRSRVRESMDKVEEEMEKARARAAELQARWTQIASALPAPNRMDEAH